MAIDPATVGENQTNLGIVGHLAMPTCLSGDETMMEEISRSAPLLFLFLLSIMGVVGDNLPDKIEADVVEDPCVYVVVPQTRWRMSLATTRQKL